MVESPGSLKPFIYLSVGIEFMGSDSLPLIIMGGLVIAAFGWFLSGYSMYRVNRDETKVETTASTSTNQFWFGLTDEQQKEFSSIASLAEQEKWVQDNAGPTTNLISPVVLIRELANQGRILYGVGNSFSRQFAVDYAVKKDTITERRRNALNKVGKNFRYKAAAINREREEEGLPVKHGFVPKSLRNR